MRDDAFRWEHGKALGGFAADRAMRPSQAQVPGARLRVHDVVRSFGYIHDVELPVQ
jgi:hypothetical protein